jgi:signal transduction histidine kinase
VVPFRRFISNRFAFTPLGVFLVATLALALWLGYQALDAAASHRRTAEAVLRDYALISATEMADYASDNVEDVLEDIFDNVDDDLEDISEAYAESEGSTTRRRRELPPAELPPAANVRRDIAEAMRDEGCSQEDGCRGFRNPVAVFRLNQATLEAEFVPDTLSESTRRAIVETARGWSVELDDSEVGLLTPGAGGLGPALSIGYMVWGGSGVLPPAVYGLVVPTTALGELFQEWYEDRELIPDPMNAGQPNDSLLYLTVRTPDGSVIFASSIQYPGELSATQSLDPELGSLVVQAAVRPDMAGQLIIGGLPQSRLPLLAALLLLTLGVGFAALIQLRREQNFQTLRDDFVSGVSHELRTPLAQIRMFAELQEAGKLRSDDDRRRAVSVINRESRRLTHLVENILQFSKLRRTPEQRMPRERIDFAEALEDGLDAVTPLLDDRGMRLQVNAEPGLHVVANRDAITRIVVNLLDNAVKYGRPGQTVKVAVDRVNGSAQLSVADQGPGVPPSDRGGIWKPYRRLERDVKAQLPGTGIGLSVVSQLATQHDGRAWVDDAEGGGARFVVELPLAAPAENGTREEHQVA